MTPYAVFLSEIEPNNGKNFGDRAKIFPLDVCLLLHMYAYQVIF